jgi:hypothetical protein
VDSRIDPTGNIGQQLRGRRRIGPKELIDDQDLHKLYGAI